MAPLKLANAKFRVAVEPLARRLGAKFPGFAGLQGMLGSILMARGKTPEALQACAMLAIQALEDHGLTPAQGEVLREALAAA